MQMDDDGSNATVATVTYKERPKKQNSKVSAVYKEFPGQQISYASISAKYSLTGK